MIKQENIWKWSLEIDFKMSKIYKYVLLIYVYVLRCTVGQRKYSQLLYGPNGTAQALCLYVYWL